jgi:hypothetical protein
MATCGLEASSHGRHVGHCQHFPMCKAVHVNFRRALTLLKLVPWESPSFGKQADPRFLHFNPPLTSRAACLRIPDISDQCSDNSIGYLVMHDLIRFIHVGLINIASELENTRYEYI